ncbi:hypothetical protein BBBOND_0109570 [Babesia bigemina]|uniref:Uncharacterized protein n=1 Tax=Babesia bigemina TaxID=5866 RepID=A0A061D6U8_BABBI|nr:hypothetical protein BBBOND_0109570 [Babesia bigemina]CDR94659.1 hypothetical protein BBBOND_0109570 [Babesia bigemina]|eukprot:XP_012766845.1 hypothetical protein BBBOND_0109570 [Babesia bigemina]
MRGCTSADCINCVMANQWGNNKYQCAPETCRVTISDAHWQMQQDDLLCVLSGLFCRLNVRAYFAFSFGTPALVPLKLTQPGTADLSQLFTFRLQSIKELSITFVIFLTVQSSLAYFTANL